VRPIEAKASIASAVALVLIIVTTVILGALASYNYHVEEQRRTQRLQEDQVTWTEQLAVALKLPIWNFDRPQINDIIESVMHDHEVTAVIVTLVDQNKSQHIRIRDAAGNIVEADSVPPAPQQWVVSREIALEDAVIGTVTLQVTPAYLQEALAQTLRWMLLTIAVFDILLTTCLYLLLKVLVLRPLARLENHAVALSSGGGELDALESLNFHGEIERLRDAIARLVLQLRRRYAELQQTSESLRLAQERALQAREEFGVRLLNTQEQERRRIAGELHDSVGQELSLISNRAQLALADPQLSHPAASHLQAIVRSNSQAIAEVRSIVRRLRPLHIELLGFTASLDGLLDHVAEGAGLPIERHLEPVDDLLDSDRATHLYRIAQEALNNAMRHAQAQRIVVRLERDMRCLRLEITDDGRGLDLDSQHSDTTGLGLTSMQERAKILGGTLRIDSTPEQGTSVRVELPIGEAEGGLDPTTPS
jgi:signal transduction histidine kinase